MKPRQFVLGIALLAVATFTGWEAVDLTYWTPLGPGPGFFPLWLSVLLGALSLLVCVKAWPAVRQGVTGAALPEPGTLGKMAVVVGALIGVVVLLEPLGFRLAMFAMYLVILYGLGRRDLVISPLVAWLGSFGTFHVFTQWLAVPLPTGTLGW